MATEKRPVGRPRTRNIKGVPGDYVGFRAPRELKEQLEKSAAKNGRSLSSEAQFRLNQSFMFDQLFGEWRVPHLWFDVAAQAERHASRRADELGIEGDWSTDQRCFVEAMIEANGRLLDFLPGDLDDESGWMLNEMFKRALVREYQRRKGILPGGFIEWPEKKEPQP